MEIGTIIMQKEKITAVIELKDRLKKASVKKHIKNPDYQFEGVIF